MNKNLAKITLADGKEYELSPLNLNILADVEREFGAQFGGLVKTHPLRVMLHMLYLRLRNNYPGLTKEDVGNLVTPEKIPELNKIIPK